MNKTFASLSLGAAIIAFGPADGVTVLAGPGGYGSGGNGAVPGLARNYVVRLQERVKKADEAALRGSQLMADGDYQGAIDQYRAALDLLPDAPITEPRRRAYIKQFARASVLLARERADEGRYPEALALVEEVLQPSIDPDNIDAKRLLEQLNDPDYYSPALTPQHLERVRRVKLALKTAQGYTDLGDYDRADREYHKALNIDPYNEAARRGQEEAERHRLNYYDVAYDHTRSKMLREVAAGWESPVPANIDSGTNVVIPTDSSTTDIRRIEEKLKTIILPSVEFAETPLVDALEFLQQRSVELDVNEQDVTKKGVNIILDAGLSGGGAAAPAAPAGGDDGGFGFEGGGGGAAAVSSGGGGYGDARITLRLSNVPLAEALRYTTSLAQLKYKVEPHAVVVIPISTPDQDLFTNVYVVPPTFLSTGDGGGGGGGAAPADPFATAPSAGGGNVLEGRPTAKKILENAGINFPSGSSAIYNPTTSQLIVRNTQDQMELVEAYIESIQQGVEKQIYITSRFVEISEEDGEELGFDWLLGPFNLGTTPRVFASGGTQGNVTNPAVPGDYSFINPLTQTPIGFNNVTAGLRSGSQAIDGNTIDALIAEAAGTSDTIGSAMAPAVFGIAGVFTDPQFQVMIRALSQRKGVDLLSAPSVMARSGQRAKIEVIREFIYPTEYDPPEIPNQFGSLTATTPGSSGGTFPVTPATPTAFETRNTGVTLEVDPVLGADEFTIDLNLAPEVVEFDGFINYGSPIQTTTTNLLTGLAEPVVITENRIEMPVFNTRKVTTQVTIWDGQTVALGGLIREDIQDVEDKVPFFGDLPAVGRLFRSSVELHLKRNLTIFVKAQLMDPAGMPINGRIEEELRPEPVPRPPITTPTTFAPGPIPYQK